MEKSETPKHQAFTLNGVSHTEPSEAILAIHNLNALIVDVRESEELDIVKFDTTELIHMPMSAIADRFSELPKDRPLIIACNNGVRSTKVVNLLNVQGYTNTTNLDGGIIQWNRDGLPLILRQDLVDDAIHCGSQDKTGGCGCCGGH